MRELKLVKRIRLVGLGEEPAVAAPHPFDVHEDRVAGTDLPRVCIRIARNYATGAVVLTPSFALLNQPLYDRIRDLR